MPPSTHVFWLLLNPHDWCTINERIESGAQVFVGKWVKLLDSNDGDIVAFQFLAPLLQGIIDFPAAEQDAPHTTRIYRMVKGVREHALKSAFCQLTEFARRFGMSE